ncbi:endocuticle structural glycoprotein SgAbd-2-like [Diabrotica virgifera virgifera]|uniref:Endocuticle structural glycoprotein SgAbd-2-like n=1 Tax=Diabrotica virgifera virgifera TaxID=50390 RepID=A0A6P7F458_DIAVI|nr:endocuticle structural glycoprotein SgAbd-2-like [Diabrotica virgifera virgifera]
MRTAVIILIIFVSSALAAQGPLREKDIIPIISQDRQFNFDGTFRSSYKTGNGITVEEEGFLKNAGNKDTESEQVQGAFQYTAPDGSPIQVTYIADENGFRATGPHLPVPPVDDKTPPPIPLAILKSLEYNAAHPEENDDGEGKIRPPRRF